MPETHHSYQKCMIAKEKICLFLQLLWKNRHTAVLFLFLCSRASVVLIVEQNSCRNKRRDEGRRKTCLIKIICLELRNFVILPSISIVHLHCICFPVAENKLTVLFIRETPQFYSFGICGVHSSVPSQTALVVFLGYSK